MKRPNRDHLYEQVELTDLNGKPSGKFFKRLKPNIGLKDHLTKAELKVLDRMPVTYQLSIALSVDPFEAFYSHVEMMTSFKDTNIKLWKDIVKNSKPNTNNSSK